MLASSTASTETKNLALQWFRHCSENHITCNHTGSREKWVPTRLVHIESADTVRVIETGADTPTVDYIALSHCWGSHPLLTLTQANYTTLQTGLPMSALPKTFRHAIEVAMWFSIKYLWIDSLCIIQDSTQDWQSEAVTMKDVYKNAILTIAATGAANSTIGCFFERDQTLNTGFEIPVSRDGKTYEQWICFDMWLWANGVSQAALNKRAWVVQERLLSRRVLHFGTQQVFWECRELDACEACPHGLPNTLKELNRFKSIGSSRVTGPDGEHSKYATYLGQWEYVVDAYTRSHLTRSTDKVVAIAGIASDFVDIYKDEYLAGLWRQYLPEQLMWKVSLGDIGDGSGSWAKRSPYYRAPSWSWLTIDGPVDAGSSHGKPVLIGILDVKVNHQISTIQSGYLRLHGVLREVRCEHESHGSVRLYDEDSTNAVALGEMDDKVEAPPDRVVCLPIITGWFETLDGDTMYMEGLMLKPTRRGEAEYVRVGWFSVEGQERCESIAGGPCAESICREMRGISGEEDGDGLFDHLHKTMLMII